MLRRAGKRESLPQPARQTRERACYTRRASARATPMRCTLVVPGLLDWPSSALDHVDQQAPALARLIACAGAPAREPDGVVATACRVCGIAKQQDWPVAPWLAQAAGVDVDGAYWLCADPASYRVGSSDVRLGGLLADLDTADADALVAMLNAHFAGDGIGFVAPTPAHWFVRAEATPRIVTRPPAAALGAPLAPYLAAGPDAALWRRWQSELQMLLYEHAVNRRREAGGLATVDGVWLWGGGSLVPPAAPVPRIFADGDLVHALAASAGCAPAPLPTGFAALPSAAARVVWLDALAGETGATQLAAADSAWIAPAERALYRGSLDELELILTGRALALGFRVSRPSWLVRWRRHIASPRAAPLLLRLIAETAGD
jgi:hypothetical protein